jgi:hypothetical protein
VVVLQDQIDHIPGGLHRILTRESRGSLGEVRSRENFTAFTFVNVQI